MPLTPASIADARKAIDSHNRLLIVPHANVDPDGLSSALACYSVFKALGKDCTVICPDTPPEALKFLPGFENLVTKVSGEQEFIITLDCSDGVEVDKLRYTVEDNKVNIIVVPKKGKIKKQSVILSEGGANYDLIVVVDTAELSLLGSIYTDNVDLFSEVPILNIDHHVSNTQFGQLHLIDPTSASATEVLYSWFVSDEKWKSFLTPDVATLLLTGLITDTRSFQNPNTTPKSLEVAANLLDFGARQQEIIKHIYKTKPLSTLKIWGRALNGIQMDPSARIVWSSISLQDLQEMGATAKETAGILDELISTIPDADVHVLFTETEAGLMKASVRSSPSVDVNVAAGRLFGGGGHARASGFKVKGYSNFQLAVLESVQKLKDEVRRQLDTGNATLPPEAGPTPMQRAVVAEAAKSAPVDVLQGVSANGAKQGGGVDVVKELGNQ